MLSLSTQEIVITFNAEVSDYYKKFNSLNSLEEKTIKLYFDNSMYLKEIHNHVQLLDSSAKTIKTQIKNDSLKTLEVEFYEDNLLVCSKFFSYNADTIFIVTERNGIKHKTSLLIDDLKKEIKYGNLIIKQTNDSIVGSENNKTLFIHRANELINFFKEEPSSRYLYGLNNTDLLIEAYTAGYDDTWNLMFENNHILVKAADMNACNNYKQIINYLILQEYDLVLADLMFEYFLRGFFSLNKVKYFASSHLVEKDIVYSESNLGCIDGQPWSTSVNGGIGEKIEIIFPLNCKNYLYVYNGYQLPQGDSVYFANSRLKKIKITNVNTLKSKIFSIADEKYLQKLNISSLVKKNIFANEVRLLIEVLEIYSGNKYNNLGVQAIIPVPLSQ